MQYYRVEVGSVCSDAGWREKVWAVKQCEWRMHTCTRTQIQKHVASYKLMLRTKLGSADSECATSRYTNHRSFKSYLQLFALPSICSAC